MRRYSGNESRHSITSCKLATSHAASLRVAGSMASKLCSFGRAPMARLKAPPNGFVVLLDFMAMRRQAHSARSIHIQESKG